MELKRPVSIMIIFVSVCTVLIYAKAVLIPIVLAILLWFVLREVRNLLQKFAKAGKLPRWVQNVMAFVFVFFILSLISKVLSNNIQQISTVFPIYEDNLNKVVESVKDKFGFDIPSYFSDFDLQSLISKVVQSLSGIIGKAFMILVYVIFLMMEERNFRTKIKLMYPEQTRYQEVMSIIEKINQSISSYISLKTFSSALTGFLSFLVLKMLGIDFPVLWATIIFLFNYIPTIGSLVATAFPALIAMLQFGDPMKGLYVLMGIGAVQIVVGNFLEPKIMGENLNISPMVVIMSLSIFGFLWGVTGMFLCVPITVILIILFSNFESTKNIAILLSSKGKV